MRNRKRPEISAGSMADIAFLLLVFFLVTTSMDVDKGIFVRLPAFTEKTPDRLPAQAREVLEVLINKEGHLLVEQEELDWEQLAPTVLEHLLNYGAQEHLSTSPSKAIVALQNDRATIYQDYLRAYNEIKTAYRLARETLAIEHFGKSINELSAENLEDLKRTICPLRLSESDPYDFE